MASARGLRRRRRRAARRRLGTATEVALLSISAGLLADAVPLLAVLSLPIVFAAGMSAMDTADGAFMSHAYGWAFSNPVRKVYYNITVTTLPVLVALAIGYSVVALFVVAWTVSVIVWQTRRIEAHRAQLAARPLE